MCARRVVRPHRVVAGRKPGSAATARRIQQRPEQLSVTALVYFLLCDDRVRADLLSALRLLLLLSFVAVVVAIVVPGQSGAAAYGGLLGAALSLVLSLISAVWRRRR